MDVSIIIVNYNTKVLTSQCINSIYEKTQGISFEVILVDNASIDGSKEHFQSDSRVRYIYSEENLGFGRANNLGVSVASGLNILFLNPDTVLINNAVKILVDYTNNHPYVGACCGNLYDGDMRPTLSFKRIFPGILDELNNLLFHIPEKIFYGKSWFYNVSNQAISVANVSGADMMVKKTVLDQVGTFSPDFFMYYEETDLCYRIHCNGYKLMSLPFAKIQHLEGKSFQSSVNVKRLRLSEQGRMVFYKRNYSINYQFVANTIYRIALYIHQIVYILLGNTCKANTCKCRRTILSEIIK